MKKHAVPAILLAATVACIPLMACSNSSNEESYVQPEQTTSNESAVSASQLSMDDLDWSVAETIVDGERSVCMALANNSPYTIAELEITFVQTASVTDEELEAYYADIKELLSADDDDMEEVRSKDISMYAHTSKLIAAGESTSDISLYYYSGWYYMKNIDHYALVEPDIATIKFIDGDKVYTEYYDFQTNKYTIEDDATEAYQWTTSALGDKLPKPETEIVAVSIDYDDSFSFDAYGMSLEDFNAYVKQCKSMGYTVDSSEWEGFYSANDETGYDLYMNYDEDDDEMYVSLDAPEEPVAQTDEAVDTATDAETDAATSETLVDGMRPEFKTAMDDYESFMNEYADFMNKYAESDGTDPTLLADYATFMTEYAEMVNSFDAWDDGTLNDAELSYYLEVQTRVNQRLLEVAS